MLKNQIINYLSANRRLNICFKDGKALICDKIVADIDDNTIEVAVGKAPVVSYLINISAITYLEVR